jgi:hypothetical protein
LSKLFKPIPFVLSIPKTTGLTQRSSFLRFPIPTNLFAAPFGLVKRKSHWFAGQKAMLFAAST